MNKKCIKINDILDELSEENKRLLNELIFANKCLKVLNDLKSFVDLNFDKLKTDLNSTETQKFEVLQKQLDDIWRLSHKKSDKINGKTFGVNTNSNNSKKKLNKIIEQNVIKNKTISSGKAIVCGFIGCGKEFKSNYLLEKHSNIHTNTKQKPLFKCNLKGCRYQTIRRRLFEHHMRYHEPVKIKRYQCNICAKSFTRNDYIKDHINTVHTTFTEPIICDIDNCQKSFKNASSLKVHQKLYHSKLTKRLSCDYPNCDFKTAFESILTNHKLKHSNDKQFVCSIEGCDRRFKTPYIMQNHVKDFHRTGHQFECSFIGCGKTFKNRSGLHVHSSSHSGIRSHRCDWPGCGYTTHRRDCLNRHMVMHSDERRYHCHWPQCDKRFKRPKDLDQHLRIHRNDKRYVCHWPGCQYRCVQNENLKKHVRQVHLRLKSNS